MCVRVCVTFSDVPILRNVWCAYMYMHVCVGGCVCVCVCVCVYVCLHMCVRVCVTMNFFTLKPGSQYDAGASVTSQVSRASPAKLVFSFTI